LAALARTAANIGSTASRANGLAWLADPSVTPACETEKAEFMSPLRLDLPYRIAASLVQTKPNGFTAQALSAARSHSAVSRPAKRGFA